MLKASECCGTHCRGAAALVAVGEELIKHHPKTPDVRSHRELALSQRLWGVPVKGKHRITYLLSVSEASTKQRQVQKNSRESLNQAMGRGLEMFGPSENFC